MKRQNKMASRNFEQTSYDLIVIWRVLDHCNLQCPFCEFSRDLQFSRTQTDSKDVIRFARVLGEYSRQTNQKLMVSWMGGEPFLWKDIFAVSEQLKQEHGLHISVTTNGTFLSNRDFTEQICRLFDELTVSIDGYGSLHDRIRRSDGLFEGILEGLRHMNELRATTSSPLKTIRVNSIMTSASIRGSEFFCHQLAAAGVDEISFNQLIADKSSELYTQLGLKSVHLKDLNRLQDFQTTLFQKHGVVLLGAEQYFERVKAYINDEPVPIVDCNPGSHILFVDQFGRIGPCSFIVAQTGTHVTDVTSTDKLIGLSDRFRQIIAARSPSFCNNCMDPNVFGKFVNPISQVGIMRKRTS